MSTRIRPTPRSIECAACGGTGCELTCGRAPEGWRHVGITTCFWCDGRGYVESDCAPDICPACRRPGVVIDGEAVCPDCTAFTIADGAEALPDAA